MEMGKSQNEEDRLILTFNVGSSTLKFALYDEKLTLLKDGSLPLNEGAAFEVLKSIPRPKAIGHRIVYGGEVFEKPVLITDEVLKTLNTLIPFSPLHLPVELDLVKRLQKEKIPQIACFDTSFHQSMPALHKHFSLPKTLWEEGVKKYGFHGLSYEYILLTLGDEAKGKRIIIAHLGSGASMAAVLDGKPIDTTMGFTPAGGLMMGTRSGDLDPGILTYLLREKKYGAKELDDLINHKSGLLGVSDISSDMKDLLSKKEEGARIAVDLFCYIARKHIGALTAVLGGLDLLVFTGGIGERSEPVRTKICEKLEFLGIQKKTKVIPTNENLMIATHAKKFL